MNSSRLTKEGKLNKYRNFLKGWKERYFKLERSYLHYYETQYAAAPHGSITRGDISLVKVSDGFPGLPYVFELYTKTGLIWYLQASSQEEMVAWMRVLYPSGNFVDPPTDEGATQVPMPPVVSGISIPPVQPSAGFPATTTESAPGIPVMVGPTPQGTLPNQQIPGSYNQGTYIPRPYLQGTPLHDVSQGCHIQTPAAPYLQGTPLHAVSQGCHMQTPAAPYLQGVTYNVTDYRLYPQLNRPETPPFNPGYREMQGPTVPQHSSPPPSYEESAQAPPLPSKS